MRVIWGYEVKLHHLQRVNVFQKGSLRLRSSQQFFPSQCFFSIGFVRNISLLLFEHIFLSYFLIFNSMKCWMFLILCKSLSYVPQKYGIWPIFCTYLKVSKWIFLTSYNWNCILFRTAKIIIFYSKLTEKVRFII